MLHRLSNRTLIVFLAAGVLAAAAAATAYAGATGDGARPAAVPARELVFVGPVDEPPFFTMDASGRPQGFTVELLRALSRETGVDVVFRQMSRAQRRVAIANGDADLADVAVGSPLSHMTSPLVPLWHVHRVAVYLDRGLTPPARLSDLAGATVAVVANSTSHEALMSLPAEKRARLVLARSYQQAIEYVRTGRARFAVGNSLALRRTAAFVDGPALSEAGIGSIAYTISAVPGHEDLQPKFAAAYLRLQESGELTSIIERSLLDPGAGGGVPTWMLYVIGAVGVGLLALIPMAFWSRSLHAQVQRRTRELQAAGERQAFQAHVLTQVTDAIVVTDQDARVVSWNPGAERLFGQRTGDVLGRRVADVIALRPLTAGAAPGVDEALAGGIEWRGDTEMTRSSGDVVVADFAVRPVADQDGQSSGSLIVARDITARRASELEGRVRWRQQAAVASLGQRALAGIDFNWLIAQATSVAAGTLNLQAAALFGATPGGQTMVLRAAEGLVTGGTPELHVSSDPRSYPGHVLTAEGPVVVNDHRRETRFTFDPLFGPERVAASVAVAVPGRSGPYGVLMVVSHEPRRFSRDDLHFLQGIANVIGATYERALVERELRSEIALHEATLEATAEGVLVTDAHGHVTRFNQKAIELWSYPQEIVETRDMRQWVAWGRQRCEDSDGAATDVEAAAHSSEVLAATLRFKDGRVVERHAQPQIVDGEIVGRVWSYRDVTERVRAEEERRALEAQIQHVQKLESLGVLAGGIAHDFNNLLVGILGHASLALADTADDSPMHARVKQIEAAAQHAAELTNQMLAYSGKGPFVLQRSSLTAIVEEMANLLRTAIARNVELHLDLEKTRFGFDGDQAQVRQVVMNLITNAADAIGDAPGTIRLRTGQMTATRADLVDAAVGADLPGGEYVFVEVDDNGCGMDRATLARIFDPFFTTKFTGRGLGLAAVLGIVRGHNGAITIRSEAGTGTTFRVLLPATALPLPVPVVAAPRLVAAGGRILVVDDEAGVRVIARESLRRVGFTVQTADDGEEAVSCIRAAAEPFDAVLLDMTMPKMSGVEALQAIRRLHPHLPVVLTSGYSEQDATARIGSDQIAGFIQKPFKPSALVAVISAAVTSAALPEAV